MQKRTLSDLFLACFLIALISLLASLTLQKRPLSPLEEEILKCLPDSQPQPKQVVDLNRRQADIPEIGIDLPVTGGAEARGIENAACTTGLWWPIKELNADEILLHVHPLHQTKNFSTTVVTGRRRRGQIRWTWTLPTGPCSMTMAEFDLELLEARRIFEEIKDMLGNDRCGQGSSQGLIVHFSRGDGVIYWQEGGHGTTYPGFEQEASKIFRGQRRGKLYVKVVQIPTRDFQLLQADGEGYLEWPERSLQSLRLLSGEANSSKSDQKRPITPDSFLQL